MTRFLLNQQRIEITEHAADRTLLNYLREDRKDCGTKEGCASGDCGACTVVTADIVKAPDGKETLHYRAINSCITLLGAVNGKQVLTVEHLAEGQKLHPIQQALVKHHATQCGFCTPGFVMSMFALYKQRQPVDRQKITHALSGNLCRCTGYRPIVDAAMTACASYLPDQFDASEARTLASLRQLKQLSADSNTAYWQPTSRHALRILRLAHPDARLVAGSTDLALEITQQHQQLPKLIDLTQVPELRQLTDNAEGLRIGAALSYSEFAPLLLRRYPELTELIERLGSLPVRNRGTLGGNLGNASPIGDSAPFLLALNAQLCLDNGQHRRQLPVQTFFTDYRKTRLAADEWIEAVVIPHAQPLQADSQVLRAYKVSKRFDDDISTVCAVFNLQLRAGNVVTLGSGFGGVAATPATLPQLEQALAGQPWSSQATYALGEKLLTDAFSPIDDVRASARYRQQLLVNLWRRFWLESQPSPDYPVRLNEEASYA